MYFHHAMLITFPIEYREIGFIRFLSIYLKNFLVQSAQYTRQLCFELQQFFLQALSIYLV